MLIFGFSINLLTLLALVLGIGLVVDDAIIVVENVERHLEAGMKPIPAATQAARELGGPIVAMTIVLIAVYVPIGFQSGLTGALFTEFAFTLVGAITVSAIVALTLSPMMCSRLLKARNKDRTSWQDRLVDFLDRRFESLRHRYQRWLHGSLNTLPVTIVFAVIVLSSIYFLYASAQTELAPQEDQGIVITQSTPAPNSTLQQRQMYAKQTYDIFRAHPEVDNVFQLDIPGQSIAGMVLKPWDQRRITTNQLQPIVQQEVGKVAGERIVAFQPPPLPGSMGLPIQFVIGTTEPFARLNDVAQKFLQEAVQSGMFIYLDTDLKIDQPQSSVVIDRDKASELGLTMADVGGALASMLGGGYVNYFDLQGRSYKVIPQVQQRYRLNPDQVMNYYIRAADGTAVPVSTVAHIVTTTVPESLNHFQQINSATIQGVAAPGVTLGAALAYLNDLASRTSTGGLFRRPWRAVAAIRAGIDRLRHDLRLRADHHLPGAGRPVRKLPRSAGDPGLGADVHRRRAGLHQHRHRRRHAQYLHPGRPGDLDGPDQQARHSDRRVRQRAPGPRQVEARGDRGGRRHPPAPDPDDHRRDGAGRHSAHHRHRRRRPVALQHGAGDRQRHLDRHAVHAVRRAGGLHADRRRSLPAAANGR